MTLSSAATYADHATAAMRSALRNEPTTERTQKRGEGLAGRALAGSAGVATCQWWPCTCSI